MLCFISCVTGGGRHLIAPGDWLLVPEFLMNCTFGGCSRSEEERRDKGACCVAGCCTFVACHEEYLEQC